MKKLVIHIEGLDSTTISELRREFPTLEKIATIEPSQSPVVEDQELGTLVLTIQFVVAGISLTTAILNFLNDRQKRKNSGTDQAKELPSEASDSN